MNSTCNASSQLERSMTTPGVVLSALELEVVDIFLSSVAFSKKETTIRIAGGWVRDKLLGMASDDIDVALDDCSGVEFAEHVNAYLSHIGEEVRSVGVIHANPDQSKHLETATIKVKGIAIDCVNLRSESYADDSRIPEIKCGTPYEDAIRRDFTLNSLFYNASTGKVEDFTNKGVDDLRRGLIRTPMDPIQTFVDDPLRVLRAIRFAARYDFALDESLVRAASSNTIREALLLKVSRERVVKELDKMLGIAGYDECLSRPALALVTIHKLGLFRTIFSLPDYPEYIRPTGAFVPQPQPTKKASKIAASVPNELVFRVSNPEMVQTRTMLDAWETRSINTICWLTFVLVTMVPTRPTKCSPYGDFAQLFDLSQESLTSASTVTTLRFDPSSMSPTPMAVEEAPCFVSAADLREGFTASMSSVSDGATRMNDVGLDSLTVGLTYLTAAVVPLVGLETPDTKKPAHTHCMKKLANSILRDNLKASNDHCRRMDALLDVQSLLVGMCRNGCTRVDVVMLLRQCKHDWRAALLLALAGELAADGSGGASLLCSFGDVGVSDTSSLRDARLTDQQLETVEAFSRFAKALVNMRIDDCWHLAPLFDGKTIQKELGMSKGPAVGRVVDAQLRWQIGHPSGTKEECMNFLRASLE